MSKRNLEKKLFTINMDVSKKIFFIRYHDFLFSKKNMYAKIEVLRTIVSKINLILVKQNMYKIIC